MRRLWVLILVVGVLLLGLAGCGDSRSGDKPSVDKSGQEQALPVDSDHITKQGSGLRVHFIDVGQGDSILVITPAGQAMLVDAGESEYGQQVVDYLRAQGVQELAVLVATHPHADHIGGLAAVLGNFKVNRIFAPRVTNNTDQFAGLLTAVKAQGLKINTAQAGVNIPLSGVNAEFIAPLGQSYENLNDYSAVIKLSYNKTAFLLTGDAGEVSENEMLASGVDLKADVLKVGHHGSYSSTGRDFLQAAGPAYGVIMCGAGNDYGHPHQETLDRLTAAGVKVYRTDLNGSIVVESDGAQIKVSTIKNVVAGTSANSKIISGESAVAAPGNVYIGNRNSLKFHRTSCTTLPKEANRVYFKNREEAIAAGYSPCGRCRP